jgi:hypothetical protein
LLKAMSRQLPRQDKATGFQFQTMDRPFSKPSLADQLKLADGSWFVDNWSLFPLVTQLLAGVSQLLKGASRPCARLKGRSSDC